MKRIFWALLVAFTLVTMAGPEAQAQSSYRVKAGDVLAVEVLEDPKLNRQVLVLPDGRISFPLVGTVPVAGQSVGAVSETLTSALAPNFAAPPNVFVTVASLSEPRRRSRSSAPAAPETIDVYGIGELKAPGRAEIKVGTTLLQYLAAAGGFTPFAATKRIQLRRNDPSTGQDYIYRFNYRAVTRGAHIKGDFRLMDGDVIIVPERRLFE